MKVALAATVALLAVFLILAGMSSALAMDVNGRYFALGTGSRSCGDYLKLREKRLENFTPEQYEIAEVIVEHWVAGFLTAHNFYVTDTFDIVGIVTMDQLKQRLDKYCRGNPNNRVTEGMVTAAHELHPARIRVDTAKGAR